MSASQFFAHRDSLMATARLPLRGLVSYTDINDKINLIHPDKLFAVIYTYDNGCPEDYNREQRGLFRLHEDAAFVMKSLRDNDSCDDVSYHIELVRVY